MSKSDETLVMGNRILTLDPRPQGKVTIELQALSRHACILGTTGSGKSVCASILCLELARFGVPTVVLDRTGEYAALVSSAKPTVLKPGENLSVSPFDPKGGFAYPSIEDWISLLDHFSHVTHGVGLSPLQYRVLRETFDHYYHGTRRPLSIADLLVKLDEYEREADAQNLYGWPESIEALRSKLWPLCHGIVGKAVNTRSGTFDVQRLFAPGLTIIDLSPLPDDRAKNMLSQIILKEVYEAVKKRGRTEEISLVMVVDEAQHLAPNEKGYFSVPEKCATELRKYGFCLVTCATRPSLISPNIIANSNTILCHMLNNQLDVDMAAGFFVGLDVKDSLRRLPVGVALLQVNHPEPKDPTRVRIGTVEQRTMLGLTEKNGPTEKRMIAQPILKSNDARAA